MLSWQVAPFFVPVSPLFFYRSMQLYYYCMPRQDEVPVNRRICTFPTRNKSPVCKSDESSIHPSEFCVLFYSAARRGPWPCSSPFGHRRTKVQRRSALLQVKYILLLFAVASGRARYRRVDASTDAFGREPGTPMPVPEPYAGRCSAREMPNRPVSPRFMQKARMQALQLRCWRWACIGGERERERRRTMSVLLD